MTYQIVELSHYQFVTISGPDARKFLQGQLSCNMDLLSPQRSLRAALCNLKGRVIADLRVLQIGETFLLQTVSGIANIVITTLSKYAVFSKVKLEIMDVHPASFGVFGSGAESMLTAMFEQLPSAIDEVSLGDDASLIRIGGKEPRYELWARNKPVGDTFRRREQQHICPGLEQWKRADMRAGIVHVDLSMSEEYTPQLLNYDISGVIDFKKGCYTGQEVVARMFYRGTAKKRLYLGTTDCRLSTDDSVLQPGDIVGDKSFPILTYSNAGDKTGESNLLLAVLNTDAVESGQKFVLADQADAELQVQGFSYG